MYPTKEGWLYVASPDGTCILENCEAGNADHNNEKELVTESFYTGYVRQRRGRSVFASNSMRGSVNNASTIIKAINNSNGMKLYMSRKGNCYE